MSKPNPAQKAWVDGAVSSHKPVARDESWWATPQTREQFAQAAKDQAKAMQAGRFGSTTLFQKDFD